MACDKGARLGELPTRHLDVAEALHPHDDLPNQDS